jgi:hypothetical protein
MDEQRRSYVCSSRGNTIKWNYRNYNKKVNKLFQYFFANQQNLIQNNYGFRNMCGEPENMTNIKSYEKMKDNLSQHYFSRNESAS